MVELYLLAGVCEDEIQGSATRERKINQETLTVLSQKLASMTTIAETLCNFKLAVFLIDCIALQKQAKYMIYLRKAGCWFLFDWLVWWVFLFVVFF